MTDNAKIHNEENWSAAGVVGMFDSALLSRARRRHRVVSCCMCLIVGVILGIPLLLLAQRQAAEFERLKATGKIPVAANLQMVPIAAGTFMMGEGSSAKETTIDKPFYAGKYEVTIGQILTWLNSSGVVFKEEWIDRSDSECPVRKSGSKFELNTSTKFGTSPDQPMVCISWFGAKAFCEWCSQQDSRFTYRLPTEAEWEYLARAGSTTAYPWGDSCNGTEANIDGTTSKGPYLQKTTTVGSFKPNAWGIFDTVGNCWEWCEDNYYSSVSSGSVSTRVLRGGSWDYDAIDARSSNRYHFWPNFRNSWIGFRVLAK